MFVGEILPYERLKVRPLGAILFSGGILIMAKSKFSTRYVAVCAMFCAIAYVLTLIGQLVPQVAGFLSYDPKDVAVVIIGFILGPLASVFVSVIVSFIEMISISGTGPIGFLMNVLSTVAFAVPAAIVYKKYHSQKGAIFGLAIGVVSMAAFMVLWNYIVTPLYMSMGPVTEIAEKRKVVASMLVPVFLPLNLIKGSINALLTMLVYKPVVGSLRAAKLIDQGPSGKGKLKPGYLVVTLVLLAVCVVLFLKLAGKI